MTRVCAVCGERKVRNDYSKKQWAKGSKPSKCLECTSELAKQTSAANVLSATSEPAARLAPCEESTDGDANHLNEILAQLALAWTEFGGDSTAVIVSNDTGTCFQAIEFYDLATGAQGESLVRIQYAVSADLKQAEAFLREETIRMISCSDLLADLLKAHILARSFTQGDIDLISGLRLYDRAFFLYVELFDNTSTAPAINQASVLSRTMPAIPIPQGTLPVPFSAIYKLISPTTDTKWSIEAQRAVELQHENVPIQPLHPYAVDRHVRFATEEQIVIRRVEDRANRGDHLTESDDEQIWVLGEASLMFQLGVAFIHSSIAHRDLIKAHCGAQLVVDAFIADEKCVLADQSFLDALGNMCENSMLNCDTPEEKTTASILHFIYVMHATGFVAPGQIKQLKTTQQRILTDVIRDNESLPNSAALCARLYQLRGFTQIQTNPSGSEADLDRAIELSDSPSLRMCRSSMTICNSGDNVAAHEQAAKDLEVSLPLCLEDLTCGVR